MLFDFLNFLGLGNNKTIQNKTIKNANLAENKQEQSECIIKMQNPTFKEEITTEMVIKDGKKIEIKRVKNIEPLDNNKALITTKIYKKEITR